MRKSAAFLWRKKEAYFVTRQGFDACIEAVLGSIGVLFAYWQGDFVSRRGLVSRMLEEHLFWGLLLFVGFGCMCMRGLG